MTMAPRGATRSFFEATAAPGTWATRARFSARTGRWSRFIISTRPETRNVISAPQFGMREQGRRSKMLSRPGLRTAAIVLSLAMVHAQDGPVAPIAVQRLDGPELRISNYAEHGATVVLFLSTRSEKTADAAAAIRQLNSMNRRRRVMFVGVFPNPA